MIGIFFTGALLIEVIFSLMGWAWLAGMQRDYPVIFGTLFLYTVIGLLLKLISDLTYVWVDPRIDFASRVLICTFLPRLSPITLRRLARLLTAVHISLWLFGILFIISLFAELVANDKPIVMQYDDGTCRCWWIIQKPSSRFPPYPCRLPGPVYPAADQRPRQRLADHSVLYQTGYADDATSPAPDSRHWLGTDDQGRDVLARVIYGFRLSVAFALVLTAGSLVIGVFAGGVQGYFGGKVDLIGQRVTEMWSGLPVLFLLIILASFVQPGFWWLLGIMLLFSWLGLVDIVRAEFLRARNLEYVRAAKAMGLPSRLIMWRHVLLMPWSPRCVYSFLFTGAIAR